MGIIGVAGVEGDGAVIGIHDRLDGVPNIIAQLRGRLRVGKAVRHGIAVHVPQKTPLRRNNQIGVGVEAGKGGNAGNPLPDIAVIHDAAVGRDVIGQEDGKGAETDRIENFPEKRQRYAASAS